MLLSVSASPLISGPNGDGCLVWLRREAVPVAQWRRWRSLSRHLELNDEGDASTAGDMCVLTSDVDQ